jgi:hypothetical protein
MNNKMILNKIKVSMKINNLMKKMIKMIKMMKVHPIKMIKMMMKINKVLKNNHKSYWRQRIMP